MRPLRSPLTLLIVGMLAGYHCRCAIALLRWRDVPLAAALLLRPVNSENPI